MNHHLIPVISDIDKAISDVEIIKSNKLSKLEIHDLPYLKVYGLYTKIFEQYCELQKFFKEYIIKKCNKSEIEESISDISTLINVRSVLFAGDYVNLTIETNKSIIGFSYRL